MRLQRAIADLALWGEWAGSFESGRALGRALESFGPFARALATDRCVRALPEPHRSVLRYVYCECGEALQCGWREEPRPKGAKRNNRPTGRPRGRPRLGADRVPSLWPEILRQVGGRAVLERAEQAYAERRAQEYCGRSVNAPRARL